MFFYLAKIGFFFIRPSNFLVFLLAVGVALLFTRMRRTARVLTLIAALGIVAGGFMPVANWLMWPLEQRFPLLREEGKVDGIILLGGFLDTTTGATIGTVEFNEAADRFVAFAALARRHPQARLIVSGGTNTLITEDVAEAPEAVRAASSLGIDPARIIVESESRDTYENAVYSRRVADPAPGERWLLVTSAYHMPRAVGCFRKAGFDVVAVPVDHRVTAAALTRTFNEASGGLARLDEAVREWIGLVAYRLTGRTGEFLPAAQGNE
ncbi:MAG: YdcF family protein [Flavobacteriaceae bacterium]